MSRRSILPFRRLFPALLALGTPVWLLAAGESALVFRAATETSVAFDTGVLRGVMRLDGKMQGISSLVHLGSGVELAGVHGLLSYYRVFSAGKRYGDAARAWPMSFEILGDGALRVVFPPGEEHPLELTGTFRWTAADTLDLETTVTPQVDMPKFEMFLSSYLAKGFQGYVYLKPNRFDRKGVPSFLRADWTEMIDGNYLIFPRQPGDLLMIYDGRWEIPPSPVTWAFSRYLEAPVGLRRDAASGLTAAFMARPEDCFAIAMPYNKEPPDNVAGHDSLYLSLFGVDIAAGQTATARVRLIIGKDLSGEAVIERYRAYAAGSSN